MVHWINIKDILFNQLRGTIIICALNLLISLQTITAEAQQIQQCTKPQLPYPSRTIESSTENGTTQVQISNNGVQIFADQGSFSNEVGILAGNVILQRENQSIRSDELIFDNESNTYLIRGNVIADSPKMKIKSEEIKVTDDFILDISDISYQILATNTTNADKREVQIRGKSEYGILNDEILTLGPSSLTHCSEGDDIVIEAKEFELNSNTGRGIARNAKLKFKNVPIITLPYLNFPINNERSSGFLFPKIGYSSDLGLSAEVPYYFNLAPNYDATLATTIFTKRGLFLQGEFRHLGQHSDTILVAEGIPKDKKYKGEKKRYGSLLKSKWHSGGRYYSSVELNWISDREYLDDYDSTLSPSDEKYLKQNFIFSIVADHYYVSAGSGKYVPSHIESETTYDRIPWIKLTHRYPLSRNSSIQSNIDFADFRHENKINGKRTKGSLAFSKLHSKPFGQLEYEFGAEFLQYNLAKPTTGDKLKHYIDSHYLAIDGRLYFDSKKSYSKYHWTLEPRVKYILAKSLQQDHLPIFDTSIAKTETYENLFNDSLYIGDDRLKDSSRIGIGALLTRKSDNNSDKIVQFGIGKVFYPGTRVINFGNIVNSDISKSDIFLGAKFRNVNSLLGSGILLDDEKHNIKSASLRFSHGFSPAIKINTIYRFKRDEHEQLGTALRLQSDSRWSGTIQHIESLQNRNTLESKLAIDYSACCWQAGIEFERKLNNNDNLDNSIRAYIRITSF